MKSSDTVITIILEDLGLIMNEVNEWKIMRALRAVLKKVQVLKKKELSFIIREYGCLDRWSFSVTDTFNELSYRFRQSIYSFFKQ